MGASAFGGYNQVMAGVAATLTANPAAFGLDKAHADPIAAQIGTRYVNYSVGSNNPILIKDETLIDMGPFFDGLLGAGAITSDQRAGLTLYQQVRQTTASDLIPLTAGGILGTTVGGNPLLVNGVSVPLADKYALIPSETTAILTATADFNETINSVVSSYSDRIAVADVNAAFSSFVTNQAIVSDGVMITPTFTPPFGAFSEDGVHPNSRGYAYMANIFIDAINAKFAAKIPHASLADHSGVGLPLVP
jgi:phospholipase/lecithinase/hemolysin